MHAHAQMLVPLLVKCRCKQMHLPSQYDHPLLTLALIINKCTLYAAQVLANKTIPNAVTALCTQRVLHTRTCRLLLAAKLLQMLPPAVPLSVQMHHAVVGNNREPPAQGFHSHSYTPATAEHQQPVQPTLPYQLPTIQTA
jgi:hypothetical protein